MKKCLVSIRKNGKDVANLFDQDGDTNKVSIYFQKIVNTNGELRRQTPLNCKASAVIRYEANEAELFLEVIGGYRRHSWVCVNFCRYQKWIFSVPPNVRVRVRDTLMLLRLFFYMSTRPVD